MKDFKIIKLSGGGTLLYQFSNRNKSTSVLAGFTVGTASNTQNGIAHFSEHLLFKGTEKRTKEQLEQDLKTYCSNDFNALTGSHYTLFLFRRVNELLDNAFEVASDLLLNSVVNKRDITSERGVILEEFNTYEDAKKYNISDEHGNLVNELQLSNRFTIGNKEDLEQITPKSIKDFRKKYYTRENLIISVVGSEKLSKIKKMISKYFLDNLPVNAGAEPIKPNFALSQKGGYQLVKKDTDNVLVNISLKCVGYNDVIRYPACNIINRYLTGGVDGKLFKAVRDKGLAYVISTACQIYLEEGTFDISFECSKENTNKVITEIGKVVSQIRKKGIEQSEIEKIKANFHYAQDEKDVTNLRTCMQNLNKFIQGLFVDEDDFIRQIMQTPKRVVDETFADLFSEKTTMYVTIGGKVKKDEVFKMDEIEKVLLK